MTITTVLHSRAAPSLENLHFFFFFGQSQLLFFFFFARSTGGAHDFFGHEHLGLAKDEQPQTDFLSFLLPIGKGGHSMASLSCTSQWALPHRKQCAPKVIVPVKLKNLTLNEKKYN